MRFAANNIACLLLNTSRYRKEILSTRIIFNQIPLYIHRRWTFASPWMNKNLLHLTDSEVTTLLREIWEALRWQTKALTDWLNDWTYRQLGRVLYRWLSEKSKNGLRDKKAIYDWLMKWLKKWVTETSLLFHMWMQKLIGENKIKKSSKVLICFISRYICKYRIVNINALLGLRPL